MLNVEFGVDLPDMLKAVAAKADEYRNSLGLTTIDGYLRQAIANDIYDSTFLHVKEDDWSTVLMHPEERYAGTHLKRSRASEFLINGGAEATGYNLTSFLELPTYMVEHILATLRQRSAETRRGTKKMADEIGKQEASFSNLKKDR